MAEDEMVEIVPNMRMEPLNMLCGFWSVLPTNGYPSASVACNCSEEEMEMYNSTPIVDVRRASGDIHDLYMVRSLINDIRDVRFLKVESSLESFEDARSSAVKVKNLSAMEVNVVRSFVGRALHAFYKHGSPDLVPNPEAMSARRPQATDKIQRRLVGRNIRNYWKGIGGIRCLGLDLKLPLRHGEEGRTQL